MLCFLSSGTIQIKDNTVPVPITASMGNSLSVNISQDHKSVQKKSYQMMKVRRITSLWWLWWWFCCPTRALRLVIVRRLYFWIVTRRNIAIFDLLCHKSRFIYIRCLILMLLLTICVINTIIYCTKRYKLHQVSIFRKNMWKKKEMCGINFYQILCLFSLQKLCHQCFL